MRVQFHSPGTVEPRTLSPGPVRPASRRCPALCLRGPAHTPSSSRPGRYSGVLSPIFPSLPWSFTKHYKEKEILSFFTILYSSQQLCFYIPISPGLGRSLRTARRLWAPLSVRRVWAREGGRPEPTCMRTREAFHCRTRVWCALTWLSEGRGSQTLAWEFLPAYLPMAC